MLKAIRSVRVPLSRRYLHTSPTYLQLSPSDKIWIAASEIEPTSRDYTRDLRLVRPPKNPSAKALPQIARKIVDSNPDIGIPQAVQKIAERAGYGWGKCEECSKGESPRTHARTHAHALTFMLTHTHTHKHAHANERCWKKRKKHRHNEPDSRSQ